MKLNELRDIIILSGDDYYLIKESADKIINLLPDGRNDIDFIAASEDDDLKNVLFECNNLPFISEKRIVYLNRSTNLTQSETKALNEYFAAPSDCAVLLIADTTGAFRNYYKRAHHILNNRLETYQVIERAIALAAESGVVLERAAANLLAEYTLRQMSRVSIEVAKLISYVGDKKIITAQDVKECVNPEADYQIYQFVNAATRGSGEAVRVSDSLMKSGVGSAVLLSSLIKQYRKMLHISLNKDNYTDDELSGMLNSLKFTVTNDKRLLKEYSQTTLKRILDKMYALEYAFKSGEMHQDTALMTAVSLILNRGGQ
ncbi:MAG: DNA polymerase III subunit delta [Christensenellales bacterium]|jgi:DNA polymerase-3 subunit delta